jgi:hypothetical protein
MRVGNAADLDVEKEHVWAQAAGVEQGITGFDPVPVGGKFTPLPEREFKVDTWNGIPIDIGYNPTVPTDEAFDANVMTVDTPGHSHYWDPGSESLNNQAAVVAGEYDEVKRVS